MKPWNERPFESRNLFNPAFCGVLLLRSLQGYESEDARGMPFSLALLVLPLCLHQESRKAIFKGSRSHFTKVVDLNPQILVGFPSRVSSLLPYTFEALGFVMQHRSFSVQNDGRLKTAAKCLKTTIEGTEESRECQMSARTLGKKFAVIRDRVTIFTMLGIRP